MRLRPDRDWYLKKKTEWYRLRTSVSSNRWNAGGTMYWATCLSQCSGAWLVTHAQFIRKMLSSNAWGWKHQSARRRLALHRARSPTALSGAGTGSHLPVNLSATRHQEVTDITGAADAERSEIGLPRVSCQRNRSYMSREKLDLKLRSHLTHNRLKEPSNLQRKLRRVWWERLDGTASLNKLTLRHHVK